MDPHRLVTDHTIYACVVGSQAYGLSGPDSDIDRRGVFAAPAPMFWGLDKPPSHVDGPLPEQSSWELERFCVLALKGNPTVLECLWSPIVERMTETGRELVAIRSAFLSRRLADTYGRYAADQLNRLAAGYRRTGQVRWKQAMHMLRLLLAGEHALRTGEVMVDVSDHRDRLLAVRRGEVDFEDVRAEALALEEALAAATATSPLPAEPDRAAVVDLLVRTRRASACGDSP
ncbi:MAG TPA: nucleotidyltransferase domain-containing protein [Micromonosporaceae bacterium]|nr:nucleotidyltransferase domain-containing protein [Micromonosporaceae bacterium]